MGTYLYMGKISGRPTAHIVTPVADLKSHFIPKDKKFEECKERPFGTTYYGNLHKSLIPAGWEYDYYDGLFVNRMLSQEVYKKFCADRGYELDQHYYHLTITEHRRYMYMDVVCVCKSSSELNENVDVFNMPKVVTPACLDLIENNIDKYCLENEPDTVKAIKDNVRQIRNDMANGDVYFNFTTEKTGVENADS